jgi:hypothetical protein
VVRRLFLMNPAEPEIPLCPCGESCGTDGLSG